MDTLDRFCRQVASTLASLMALLAFLGSEFERGTGVQAGPRLQSGSDRRPPVSAA